MMSLHRPQEEPEHLSAWRPSSMALNIKDHETDRLFRQLTRLTGENITQAVKTAVRQRIERESREHGRASVDDLLAIARRIAEAPDRDHRSADEILGYDERGLPG